MNEKKKWDRKAGLECCVAPLHGCAFQGLCEDLCCRIRIDSRRAV